MKIKEYCLDSDFTHISTEIIMNSCPCKHLKSYKVDNGITTYRVLHAFYVACVAKGSLKRKAQDAICSDCHTSSNRIHACLHCVYFGCFNRGHIHNHAAKENHNLAVDIKHGHIFCFECGDYTYDEDFEAESKKQKREAGEIQGTEVYFQWEPTREEIKLLKEHNDFRKIEDDSTIGLRGLIRLGQTCFMNCIVQVLVHTPLLRDYFLSDKHLCKFEGEGSDTCLACVMFDIFQEFYSGISTPFVPFKLVYATWTHATNLGGFQQQDAHEFFIAMLEILHNHCQDKDLDSKGISEKKDNSENVSDLDSKGISEKKDNSENVSEVKNTRCTCIVDQIFTGFYQSDLKCLKCKHVSTTIEPFWNISLDLGGNNEGKVKDVPGDSVSLMDCIAWYTRPENLPSECGECHGTKRTKQLTMKKLPVVTSFHLKRLAGSDKKNCTHVSFPEFLDMSDFTTEKCSVTPKITHEASPSGLDCSENKFTLFAVVKHIGTGAGGHYVSFIRQHRDKWYQCNDHLISKVSIEEVLNSEGYLLFYHKQVLEYGKNAILHS